MLEGQKNANYNNKPMVMNVAYTCIGVSVYKKLILSGTYKNTTFDISYKLNVHNVGILRPFCKFLMTT